MWRFEAQAGILAAPITYLAGGRQYVTVMVGLGTSAAFEAATLSGMVPDYRSQRRRVLTFALGGSASLPPVPPPFKLTAKLEKLTLEIDRPQLSDADIQKLRAATRNNSSSE